MYCKICPPASVLLRFMCASPKHLDADKADQSRLLYVMCMPVMAPTQTNVNVSLSLVQDVLFVLRYEVR